MRAVGWASLVLALAACGETGSDADDAGTGTDDGGGADSGGGLDGGAPADGGDPSDGGHPTDGGAPFDAGGDGGAPAGPCDTISPSDDAEENHSTISDCLTSAGRAVLTPGTYPVPRAIDVPDGAVLRGDATWPRLLLVDNEQSVVRVQSDAEVAFLRIDANDLLTVAHNAIVRILGDDAFVHDNHIQNGDGPSGDNKVTGVRFWNTDARGNRVFRNQIHDNHYGVIFDLYPNGADNVVEGNTIYDNRCDSITFRGYGRALDNTIYHNGWNCLNGIPGGGIYALGNDAGAEIVGNHVHENCGMSLDIDSTARLVVRDNEFERPGHDWGGTRDCGAGMTAHLLDVRDSVIEDNVFRKSAFGGTVGGDPNRVMSADRSGAPTDLPNGANQAVAFMLTHRDDTSHLATGNDIRGNRFIANCSAPCVGLGYFVGRGTGFDDSETWSADTTSYFRSNDPFGSDIGSKRCGGNWYAADSECPAGDLDPECNTDDPQHEGAGHDWARNDGCAHYL